MDKIDLSQFVVLFPTLAAGLLGFFIRDWFASNKKKNDKVDDHVTELAKIKMTVETIRDTVNRIEASVERLEDKREKQTEDFIKVKSQVDAAWRAIDKIQQREM